MGNANGLDSLLANQITDDVFSLRETAIPFGDEVSRSGLCGALCQVGSESLEFRLAFLIYISQCSPRLRLVVAIIYLLYP